MESTEITETQPMYAMTPESRYLRDPEFHSLVDTLLSFIVKSRFSPAELREAVMLATTKYEIERVRRFA